MFSTLFMVSKELVDEHNYMKGWRIFSDINTYFTDIQLSDIYILSQKISELLDVDKGQVFFKKGLDLRQDHVFCMWLRSLWKLVFITSV